MQLKTMYLEIFKKIALTSLLLLTLFLYPNVSLAGLGLVDRSVVDGEVSEEFKNSSGFVDTSDNALQATVASLIKIFLGLLGVIFVVLIVAAGYQWFMAGGDAKKVEDAKDKITRAVIGLVIIISAYSITFFVFKQLDDLGSVGGGGDSGKFTNEN